jgi:hypothetical protein
MSVSDSDTEGLKPVPFFWTGGGSVKPEDVLNAIKVSMEWQNAWLQAIALAWESPLNRAALLKDPRTFFKDRCKWKVPEGLDLRVTDQPKKDPQGHPTGWYPEGLEETVQGLKSELEKLQGQTSAQKDLVAAQLKAAEELLASAKLIPGHLKFGWYLAPTRVDMYLPPKPALDQQAVALANYVATGRTYPFTSC